MAEPRPEIVWRFLEGLDLRSIEDSLTRVGISHSRHSTTVSYFLRLEADPWLDSYEVHAAYSGRYLPSGELDVEKSYVRNSYGILQRSEGNRWIAESEGEQISEEEFYAMVLYSNPDRILSLQQVSFETAGGRYLVELNLESDLLVLIDLDGTGHIPAPIADTVHSEELMRSSYLIELFEHNGGTLSA